MSSDSPEPALPRRIHVIGAAGCGKTTLARKLAPLLDAPLYELDCVGYDRDTHAKQTISQREASLREIVAQPAWVTEGAFLWWIDDLLRHADAILWLDLPWTICYQRIVLRHVKADLARNNGHPGYRNLFRFAKGARPYALDPRPAVPAGWDDDGANRAAVAQVLTPYAEKVVHCQRSSEAAAFLSKIERAVGERQSLSNKSSK